MSRHLCAPLGVGGKAILCIMMLNPLGRCWWFIAKKQCFWRLAWIRQPNFNCNLSAINVSGYQFLYLRQRSLMSYPDPRGVCFLSLKQTWDALNNLNRYIFFWKMSTDQFFYIHNFRPVLYSCVAIGTTQPCICCSSILSLIQFLFSVVSCSLLYINIKKNKENKNWTKDKIELQHTRLKALQLLNASLETWYLFLFQFGTLTKMLSPF